MLPAFPGFHKVAVHIGNFALETESILVSNTSLNFQGKPGKSHPAHAWLKPEHESQAKRDQHLSQHVQESQDSNTDISKNLRDMFCN